MRVYSQVCPQFWIGETGRALRGDPVAQVVAMYLITSPHANMLGLYYLPIAFISHETGLPIEGASKGLLRCSEGGFCTFDWVSEMVWIHEMARFQIGTGLSPRDKRCEGVRREYESLPQTFLLGEFFDRYKDDFNLTHRRSGKSPSEAPSKPHRSQEQEQEQKQEQETRQKSCPASGTTAVSETAVPQSVEAAADPIPVALTGDILKTEQPEQSKLPSMTAAVVPIIVASSGSTPKGSTADVEAVFDHWRAVMNHERAKLDDKRRRLIRSWLATGYGVADLKAAIDGCSRTPHNMGHNDRNERYDSLELILRDGSHIDRFIAAADRPPIENQVATRVSSIGVKNARAVESWLTKYGAK